MGTIYIDTGGSANNSGSSDNNTADLTGTAATHLGSGVVQLDAGTNLSGVITTPGPTQSSINIAGATNTNQTIFWITAVDDALDQVTVTPIPTGMTTNAWKIGGRHVLTANRVTNAVRAGDTVLVNNSPAAAATTIFTFAVAGDSTSGYAKVVGKIGTRPVFNTTNTASCVTASVAYAWLENVELDQDGASGVAFTAAANSRLVNVKISDCGGNGVSLSSAVAVLHSEITGAGGDALNAGNVGLIEIVGNYIHDNTGDGLETAVTNASTLTTILFNIFDTNGGRGIAITGAAVAGTGPVFIWNNVLYVNGNSGIEVTDADSAVFMENNIFQDNGNAAGEYNAEWLAGAAELIGYHGYNCFYHQGGGGGANLLGLTANATEVTTDPLFTNPGSGDFTLQTSSPCKATGFPGQFLGGPLGYIDMGAVQRRERSVAPNYQMGV